MGEGVEVAFFFLVVVDTPWWQYYVCCVKRGDIDIQTRYER